MVMILLEFARAGGKKLKIPPPQGWVIKTKNSPHRRGGGYIKR
jgi:hypothetical protein